MTNILFQGGGRRVELADRFYEADPGDQVVVGYETDPQCPLADRFDVVRGLRWGDPLFGIHLLNVVLARRVDLVVPLDCRGVEALAALDIPQAVCSPLSGARTCCDKRLFDGVIAAELPDLYPEPRVGSPAVFKPARGNGARGVMMGRTWDGVARPEYVCQRHLGGPEFSVDAYFNRAGELVGASPRVRLRVAGGEVLDSETVDRPDLVEGVRRLGEAVPLRGPVCVQFMEENGKPFLIESNARFGGGSTLSCRAGLDLVGYVLREYVRNETLQPGSGKARAGVRMTRSYRDHFFAPKPGEAHK